MATYTSVMRFIEPWSQNKELPFIRTNPEPGYNYMNFEWVDREVQINNSRDQKETYSIDEHGFAYTDDIEGATQKMLDVLRENDGERIREKYYPHIEHLVKKQTGASQVIIFDHTSRKRRPELGTYENPTGKEQPATMVHCDQSTKGALRRLEQNVPVEVHNNLQKRVLMINVWRPLRGPVQDWPLATMDYRTCNEDLIYPTDLLDKTDDYRGQTVTFSHAPEQTWYYLDQQETHEVTFIKIWDNKQDVEAKLCPHAAFKHPNAPVDAPPRESIEVRCFAIFD